MRTRRVNWSTLVERSVVEWCIVATKIRMAHACELKELLTKLTKGLARLLAQPGMASLDVLDR